MNNRIFFKVDQFAHKAEIKVRLSSWTEWLTKVLHEQRKTLMFYGNIL